MSIPSFLWSRRWKRIAVCVFAALVTACSGDDGTPGVPGAPGTPGPGVTAAAESLTLSITSVQIASPPVVAFTATNEAGIRFVGLGNSSVRFTLAKLIPGTNGDSARWQNYINRTESPGGVGPGTDTAIQGTSENNGTLVNHGDGTYTYTFATDVRNVSAPLAVTYEPTLTHRLAIQVSGGGLPVANATYTWRPSDGATSDIFQHDVVQTASCNECHGKLALHGGGRIETQYCVTCHNPGTTDANSGNTVDFKVMIHKIHRGENLPSVVAGGEYAIWGFNRTKLDFSDVLFPQDIRNCSKCHNAADAATPQGDNWKNSPGREACGSCHDAVNFDTGTNHAGGPQPDNSNCTVCHQENSFPGSIEQSHQIPAKLAGAKYQLNIVSATNTAPGQFPVVNYKVTDPTHADTPYDIMNAADPVWANGSVSILLGWDTRDYHNQGNGSASAPAPAVSLNGKAASSGNNAAPVRNADGSFTVTSLRAIPASVTGSGTAGMTSRAAADFDSDGTYSDRVPIKSVVAYFPITDTTAVPRRQTVDIAKCNQCHDQLTLHGSSRTDEPQLCALCHNPRDTDIGRRPKNADGTVNIAATLDGKKEESIDLKHMIHGIHGAAFRENGLVVYGFGGTGFDFGDVRFPGILNRCDTCHTTDSYRLPLASSVLATTFDTGNILSNPGYLADQTDDRVTTPSAVVCSSCHDSAVAQTHMEQNGAQFSILLPDVNNSAETCEVCHAAGRIADVTVVHSVGK